MTLPARVVVPAALLLAGLISAAAAGAPLTRDSGFHVTAPQDGTTVGHEFLLSWAGTARPSYAVVVDATLPAPGATVRAGDHVLLVTDQSLLLSLGRAHSGSPTARGYHTVTVLPVDAAGRREGGSYAVVHVRNGS